MFDWTALNVIFQFRAEIIKTNFLNKYVALLCDSIIRYKTSPAAADLWAPSVPLQQFRLSAFKQKLPKGKSGI